MMVNDMNITGIRKAGNTWLVTFSGGTTAIVTRKPGESLGEAAVRMERVLRELVRGETQMWELTG